ncbi:glycosyltransferase family 2 protein [Paenibacillus sp. JX-17]|uniref:Glycosyltransferase family 2 protein n=1 Tax=Paenibacillus lacisoli TaxID=3064525 RepID=A0ABT9CHV0_9BACL|nr:glycosyltransferase family 2 protein [Paenibacillus sp. JX-17]MDO7908857.1 glycosyltransferase family 2 protein [Paenibacillus sp. JX-17]
MNKTLSIHIVTYNSGDDIGACLEAVHRQTYPVHEIIVIDNDSADGTVAEVKAVQNRFGGRLKLIRNPNNVGFAPAHNQAIQATQTDYVLVLNPDVTLTTEYTAQLINRMEQDKSLGSATGKLLRKDHPDRIDSTGIVMNRARRAFDRGAGEPAARWAHSGEVFGVSGAAALYSRALIQDISKDGEFFDRSFFAYKEDVDVAWRAQLLGWRAYYDAQAAAFHGRGWKEGGRQAQPLFIRRLSYINRYKMMFKNDRFPALARDCLHILAYELGSQIYFLFREPGVLSIWTSFFKEYKDLADKRRWVQKRYRNNQ